MKVILFFLTIVALMTQPLSAAIALSISGGKGESPLTINVSSGGTFTATADVSNGFVGVVFDNFYNNTANSSLNKASTATVSLDSVTFASTTGSPSPFNDFTSDDLMLAFSGVPSFNTSDTLLLGPGIRTTTGNLNLDYTTINETGNAFLVNSSFQIVSDNVTWAVVPEPSTYALLTGIACIGFVAFRKFYYHSNAVAR